LSIPVEIKPGSEQVGPGGLDPTLQSVYMLSCT
jgi:hypothetical protein